MADRICECPACCRRYNNEKRKPKFLVCHHNFCLDCVKVMAVNGQIKCPLCLSITSVNGTDFDKALLTNQDKLFMMMHMTPTAREILVCWQCNALATDLCRANKHNIIDTVKVLPSNPINVCQTNWMEAQTLRMNFQKVIHRLKVSLNRWQSQLDRLDAENNCKLNELQEDLAKYRKVVHTMPVENERSQVELAEIRRLVSKFTQPSTESKMRILLDDSVKENSIHLSNETAFENLTGEPAQAVTYEDVQSVVTFAAALAKQSAGSNGDLPTISRQPALPPVAPVPAAPMELHREPDRHQQIRPQLSAPPIPPPRPPVVKSPSLQTPTQPESDSSQDSNVSTSSGEMKRPVQLPRGPSTRPPILNIPPRSLPTGPAGPRPAGANNSSETPTQLGVILDAPNQFAVNSLIPPLTPSRLSPDLMQTVQRAIEATGAAELRGCHYGLLSDHGATFAWNPQHPTVATTNCVSDVVRILGQESQTDQLDHSNDRAHRLAWNSSGTRLATGSIKGQIRLWTSDGALLHCHSQENTIFALQWSPEDKYLASGGLDSTVCIWNMEDNTKLQRVWFQSIVWDVDWQSVDCFAVATCDGIIYLCDIGSDVPLRRFKHENWVKAVRWNRERLVLASCSTDKSVKVWTKFVNEPMQEFKSFDGSVNGIEWSPVNDRLLASCADDGTIQLLDLNSNKATLVMNSSKVKCLAFSPDGKFLATGNDRGTLEVWDARNGAHMKTFSNWIERIDRVAFDRTGDKLAVAVADEGCAVVEWRHSKRKLFASGR